MSEVIYTVYPRGWFEGRSRGGSGRAMRHAVAMSEPPHRGAMRRAFCGAYGSVSSEFTYTEPNVNTCARCVKAANARRAEQASVSYVNQQCPTCRGTGGGVWNDCPTCGGNGVV